MISNAVINHSIKPPLSMASCLLSKLSGSLRSSTNPPRLRLLLLQQDRRPRLCTSIGAGHRACRYTSSLQPRQRQPAGTMSKQFAVVAGVGPGTGAAVARKFAQSYPVALLARKPENYEPLAEEINKAGGRAIGISTDLADAASVSKAFERIQREFGGECAAAIFNASGPFSRKPFLETSEQDFKASINVSLFGAFIFSQAALPLLVAGAAAKPQHSPALIFTGATASVKSNGQMSSFSTGKYALRALSQSLAREFFPKGVHVAHAVIDGLIDIPRTKHLMNDAGPDAKISADGIADAYWHLHTQPRSAFTFEIDIRPFVEKW